MPKHIFHIGIGAFCTALAASLLYVGVTMQSMADQIERMVDKAMVLESKVSILTKHAQQSWPTVKAEMEDATSKTAGTASKAWHAWRNRREAEQ